MRIADLIVILLWPACVWAEYTATELCVIEWGEESHQLTITPETRNYPGIPDNPDDDYPVEPAQGPSIAFVDKNENVIFGSYEHQQLKGFTNSGELIFDISVGSAHYSPDLYVGTISSFYVDHQLDLYLVTFPPMDYIPVINYQGELVNRLEPFGQDPYADIDPIHYAPDGRIFLDSFLEGWVTYSDGQFEPGGTMGFAASDGNFYAVFLVGDDCIKFNKYQNPGSDGVAESREFTTIGLAVENIRGIAILNGGDGYTLYILIWYEDLVSREIWMYDLDYNFLDKFALDYFEPYWDMGVPPFLSDDGKFYEFRCLEDGLYVIRWSKD